MKGTKLLDVYLDQMVENISRISDAIDDTERWLLKQTSEVMVWQNLNYMYSDCQMNMELHLSY